MLKHLFFYILLILPLNLWAQFTALPVRGGILSAGQTIDIKLVPAHAVNVTGSPFISLTLGSTVVQAHYLSGSGTRDIIFRYTIMPGDNDSDGIALAANINLNGGTLVYFNGTSIISTINVQLDINKIKVDTTSPTILSTTYPNNGTYYFGQTLNFSTTFSEIVTVAGLPRLGIDIGGTTVYAHYVSGSGTTKLNFSYTITANDLDLNGIELLTPLMLNSGTIKDGPGNNATLSYSPPNLSSIFISGINPRITSVIPPSNGTYTPGNNLDFQIQFNKPVYVTGTPSINIGLNGTIKTASYLSGSGTNTLIFRYQVVSGFQASLGVFLFGTFNLPGGASITDNVNNIASLVFTPRTLVGVIISAPQPTIVSVSIPSSPPAVGYVAWEAMYFTVIFSEVMYASNNTSVIKIMVDGLARGAALYSGSGTNTFVYRFITPVNIVDSDGLQILGKIELNNSTITNAGGATPTLTFNPPDASSMKVDSVIPIIISNTLPVPREYTTGETLTFTTTHDTEVYVTGTPRIRIRIGDNVLPVIKYANYVSGSGTNTLTYQYTVDAADTDEDGIEIVKYLYSDLGTYKDNIGNDAAIWSLGMTLLSFDTSTININTPGEIISVLPPAVATYSTGNNLDFIVNFDRAINVTGTPRLSLNIGGVAVYANYFSGTGTNSLTFRYQVQAGNSDLDGVDLSSPIDLNSGTLQDSTGNNVHLTFTPPDLTGVLVDTSVQIISVTAPSNGTYDTGLDLNFTVTYSSTVIVTGTPRIAITVGSSTLYANYLSGSGTNALVFRYTVAAGHADSDGITLISPINLNGGTIRDTSSYNADLTYNLPNTTGILIDGIDIVISSITPPANSTYGISQLVNFIVNFNHPTFVTGTPRIRLTVGNATLYATYVSGSGSSAHTYGYTVASGHTDTNGITTVGPLQLNGGTVRDAFADNATLTFTGTTYPAVLVDGIRPTISNMTSSANATYLLGQNIDFTATYSEIVNISGSPRLTLTVGATTRYATYLSGTGTNTIIFRYTVQPGDVDTNGIAATNSIALNGGTIIDTASNAQTTLTFAVPNLNNVRVDGAVPTISSVTPPTDGSYGLGANLNFTMIFSESVNIVGTPYLQLNIGGVIKNATYLSGSGTTNIIFRYTTVGGDGDSDGIESLSPINLNGGTIKDAAGNNATLTFSGAIHAGVLVGTNNLFISAVTPPANNNYGVSQNLDFTVTFNYPAIVTGTPRIQLTVGATTLYATYLSGSGTLNLIFRYTVALSHTDTDGISSVGPLQLNGGSIRDSFNNNAILAFTSSVYPAILVDGIRPTFVSMTASPNTTYVANQNIDFTATYGEIVNITGTPRVRLTVGSTTRYADYFSGTGSNTIIFRYTVPAGDLDTNGIAVASTTLDLNGGLISDNAANSQSNLVFTAPTLTGVRVDAVIPIISSMSAPTNGSYGANVNLNFTMAFSEIVNVVGSPYFQLDIGGTIKNATYISGSGTTNIIFRYTTITGDSDLNGIESLTPIILNTGTIKDAAGNDATLSFTGMIHSGILVDANGPLISSITPPVDHTYQNGGTRTQLNFTVSYNKNITVTGTPRIHLTIGTTLRYATYLSGSGTPNLIFRYAVANTDLDLDGIAIVNSNNIDLNGGTIRDTSLNNAELNLGSVSTSNIFVVLPMMRSWYDISDSAHITTDGVSVTALLDKIGTYNLTHTGAGVSYNASGFNGGSDAYVSCESTSSFNGPSAVTPRTIVAVYKSPLNVTSQYLFFTLNGTTPMIQFSSTASGGTVALGTVARKYAAGAWNTAATTQTDFGAVDTAYLRAVSWNATQTRAHSICQMDGELAEFFFLNARPTVAQMTLIQTYINDRYGLSFP